ncbi:HNH endonuclease [Streptomyces sp. NBC_01197]|uniref:HNH endonuclease n=1 Tax=Streptomyces sp. NBC_01197 TaxID=2903768 RepID=UPI003FA3DCE5
MLARDGFKCQRCGSRENLEVDHLISVAKGGGWEMDNLLVLCHECHIKKSKQFG